MFCGISYQHGLIFFDGQNGTGTKLTMCLTVLACLVFSLLIGKCFWAYTGAVTQVISACIGTVTTAFIMMFVNSAMSDGTEDYITASAGAKLLLVGTGVGLCFANCFKEGLFSLVASFLGAYFVVRGVSLWTGGFISESQVIVGLYSDEVTPEVTHTHTMYLAAILILWCVVICKHIRDGAKGYTQMHDEK